MTSLVAAFHHAGHAVAAHLSKFHALALPLRVDAYGSGEVTAALSRRKLLAAEKVASLAARTDPDVAESIAVILCAGLACERLAAARHIPVKPDPGRSKGDLDLARAELASAGLAEDVQHYQRIASEVLTRHWAQVQAVAERLAAVDELTPAEISALIGDV